MPELPEVETTRRALEELVVDRVISHVTVRQPSLRYPVDDGLPGYLKGQRVLGVDRRAKYLLLSVENGTLIIHLGMSGSLSVVPKSTDLKKHDHIAVTLDDTASLRYHDPRRFGCWLWTTEDPHQHKLIINCGVEPLDVAAAELGRILYQHSRGRTQSVKQLIMDNRIVVGVGNIYACESLFHSAISPKRAANRISESSYIRLAAAIQSILSRAIEQGGTTLRDFQQVDGSPGYFAQVLAVYGREGETCGRCYKPICRIVQGQRSTFYCRGCQH